MTAPTSGRLAQHEPIRTPLPRTRLLAPSLAAWFEGIDLQSPDTPSAQGGHAPTRARVAQGADGADCGGSGSSPWSRRRSSLSNARRCTLPIATATWRTGTVPVRGASSAIEAIRSTHQQPASMITLSV